MKPYEQYKNSGIDWLGQVPSHWEVLSLKRVARINPSVYVKDKRSDEKVCFLPMEKVLANGQVIDDLFLPIKDISSGFTIFAKNDVIVAKITPCFENGKSAFLDKLPTEFGYGSTEFHVLRPSKKILGKFLYSIIHSKLFLDNGEAMMIGSAGQKRVPTDFVANVKIALPPLPEQTAIAKFLDEKTTQIQTAIGIKNEQIAKLKEYRQALINETVTKGLKADVAMKNSGVEWLGEVPSHWEVKRLKHTLKEKLKYGANESAEFDDRNFPRYIRITDIDENGNLKDETFKSLHPNRASDYLLSDLDILLARSGATVGKSFLYKKHLVGDACYAGYLIKATFNPKIANPYFVNYVLQSGFYNLWIQSVTIQATIQNVSAEKYNELKIPLPPLPEQLAIAEFLDEKTAQIDKAIAHHQNQIERLKEYQQSLVSEVVMGKVRVKQD